MHLCNNDGATLTIMEIIMFRLPTYVYKYPVMVSAMIIFATITFLIPWYRCYCFKDNGVTKVIWNYYLCTIRCQKMF